MSQLIQFCLFCATIASAFAESDDLSRLHKEILQPAESNNGLVGVTSIAGITSRNGRVSSLGGIQIYPGVETPITITNTDGGTYFYPLTVTKEADGKYASGSIQFIPGYPSSVVVSSTARSGFGPEIQPMPLNINPVPDLKHVLNRPVLNQFIPQLLPELFGRARNLDTVEPWFSKNTFPLSQPRPESIHDGWVYPNFNPFLNFWR